MLAYVVTPDANLGLDCRFPMCERLRMDLATYRKQRGLSQEELAQHLGLSSKGYISNIEKGERSASLHVALKIERWSGGAVKAASISPVAADLARAPKAA